MTRLKAAAVIVCALLTGSVANAEPLLGGSAVTYSAKRHDVGDPRPARWCGWWLRKHLGVADRSYNLARRWAAYGSNAHGPAPGVIAVWRHHVGIVTGVPGPGRIVLKSGNDGHAVRERERSSRGVIAYRWPPSFTVVSE